jgi:transmembrane sensor
MKRRGETNDGAKGERDPLEPDAAIDEAAAGWVSRRDAGLSAGEEADFQSWLRADPRHEAALNRYATAWATLDGPVQAGAADELLQELTTLKEGQRRRSLLSAVGVAAILLISISAWNFPRERITDPAAQTATAKIVSPSRQILPDGTMVELKDGAEIHADYSPAVRRVELRRGEAHFQVQKDPARPFVVNVRGIEVRAVGTAFAVQLGHETVEVLVTEGRVAVDKPLRPATTPPAGRGPSNALQDPNLISTLVTAGERAVIGLNATAPAVIEIPGSEMAERLSWRAPRLEFSGTPLAEAVALLNRHAEHRQGLRFVIEDPAISSIRVSGLFRADNTTAFVDLLESAFGINSVPRSSTEIALMKAR